MIDLEKKMNHEDYLAYKKCENDIIEFTKHVKIFHPKEGWINAYDNLFPKQKEILKNLSGNGRKELLVSSRQTGKTTISLIFLLWNSIFKFENNFLFTSYFLNCSKTVYYRFDSMYNKLPDFFKFNNIKSKGVNFFEFENGKKIFFSSYGAKEYFYNEPISLIILDELAYSNADNGKMFMKRNKDLIKKCDKFIVISTPYEKYHICDGRRIINEFYKLYKIAKKNKEWGFYEIKWHDVFNRGESWKNQKIEDLSYCRNEGEKIFAIEYGNKFK